RSGEEVLRPHFVQLSCTKQNSFSWRPSLTSSRGTPRHPNMMRVLKGAEAYAASQRGAAPFENPTTF
ncbi:MAG: hypothetical protein J0M19_14830, partial [Sphingomonadales bacterium]|nr:hypothetical protein [Sphingomonadales bacterium]